ncbi:MAG: MBL fold metallo-hydrolase [Candidatus Competibacterales bacterium]|nr:MBL fold metallo-hydrolase [Candidatus Competibacterales bacterium]
MKIPFRREFDFAYGTVEVLSPRLRRVVARNPGPYTFHGTNTYIVGHGRVALIDPGPNLPEHVQALLEGLRGETVSHILVTHTHRDHSPACRPLQAATGAPTHGYGPHGGGEVEVEEGGDHAFAPDHMLRDGDCVEGEGWTLEAVHTPGHTSNHLCYALREERSLFTGDHVMAWSTSVIAPPDGDLGAYLDSLERLLARHETRYWPAHGASIDDPRPFVQAFIEHRRQRLYQVRVALGRGIDTIPGLVAAIYPDLPTQLRPAAARSTQAALIHLHRRGEVNCDSTDLDARFRLRDA